MIIGVTALVVLALWIWARTSRRDVSGIADCARMYQQAATLADTIRIDGQFPHQQAKRDAMRCGALRATYPDEVVPARR